MVDIVMSYTGIVCYNKGANRDVAATLATPGYMTTLVGVMTGLYYVSSCPTNSLEGIFSLDAKRCSKCKEEKERSNFHKDSGAGDGLRSWCKACTTAYWNDHREQKDAYDVIYRAEHREQMAAYSRRYYEEHRDEIIEQVKIYRALHCKKPTAQDIAIKEEQRKKHKEEMRKKAVAYNAAWQKANPDKCRAKYHRRRARKLGNGGTHTDVDISRQGNIQKWHCWWCGDICKDHYEVDHLVPLARGGHNDPGNIVISCQHCNRTKHDKTPDEFAGRLL